MHYAFMSRTDGLTLVETLLASAIGVTVLLFTLSGFSRQLLASRRVSDVVQREEVKRRVLADVSCERTVAVPGVCPASPVVLRDRNGNPIGARLSGGRLSGAYAMGSGWYLSAGCDPMNHTLTVRIAKAGDSTSGFARDSITRRDLDFTAPDNPVFGVDAAQGIDRPLCAERLAILPPAPPADCAAPGSFVTALDFDKKTTACGGLPPLTSSCPAGQYLIGFDMATNTPSCAPLPSGASCAAGQVAVGYDSSTNRATCVTASQLAGVYVASGAIAYQGNTNDPCRNVEPYISTPLGRNEPAPAAVYRQHWVGQASCNPGDIVLGGGEYCQGLIGGATLDHRPLGGNSGWYADCCLYNDGRLRAPLPGTVYAMCLHVSS